MGRRVRDGKTVNIALQFASQRKNTNRHATVAIVHLCLFLLQSIIYCILNDSITQYKKCPHNYHHNMRKNALRAFISPVLYLESVVSEILWQSKVQYSKQMGKWLIILLFQFICLINCQSSFLLAGNISLGLYSKGKNIKNNNNMA